MNKFLITATAFFLPSVVLAQITDAISLMVEVGKLIQILLGVASGLALLAFVFGLAKFVFASGNEDRVAEGRRMMMWGIVALFVMVAVWGLVAFLQSALGLQITV